jgi:hypothetical protein
MQKGRGSNPRSHHNRKAIGAKKQVTLADNQWILVAAIGSGNYSEGARKMTRAIMAQSRLREAAELLHNLGFETSDQSPASVETDLLLLFRDLDSGRKKAADFVSELILGESWLEMFDDQLCRIVSAVSVEVAHPTDPNLHLVELRQEWNDGSIVERGLVGISEKILGGETAIAAAARGMREELKVSPLSLNFVGTKTELNGKSAYKGIASYTELHRFEAKIAPKDLKREYWEIGEKKTVVFGWRAIA